jgi:UDP-N-acetylmuramate dehydrogenase
MHIQQHIELRSKNTYKIGGTSSLYCDPISEEELKEAFQTASDQDNPVFVLGKGSNVLISDHGWSGLTINTSVHMNTCTWNGTQVRVQCGVSLNTLVNQAVAKGFAGMEELAGIPGTTGGAVIMNAGAFNSCIADTFEYATVYDNVSGKIEHIDRNNSAFSYRSSIFKERKAFVIEAVFNFNKKDSSEKLQQIQRDILQRRALKQPLEYPNCGSVFKRPDGHFAGTLIEKCGLKGLHSGDMQISEKHANFIVNRGNGRAEDVRILIRTAQKRVYEDYGILLEPEVLFIGEFDEPLFLV